MPIAAALKGQRLKYDGGWWGSLQNRTTRRRNPTESQLCAFRSLKTRTAATYKGKD
ncbi:hypothetical protein Pure05_13480 [Paenarthrobacter ureafaciens]|nr:hypothetical protein Pure01_07020 [Paenarthrobacter ureafaciens]GLU63101.1 hypothetical protein Pure02_13510 [Paenarthrobacter ureafaciens]GLU67375.1 hypothetical protein Pure03_13510 [Paenarthrobacter ureafaciens]GLU71286.1 hypothetical protein Pure04_10010 [Paenarthrobacter ureafaciens]GLU75908.1 hypothetical protein Pure05_13480 [Paenarthrobacter ureafaciens]